MLKIAFRCPRRYFSFQRSTLMRRFVALRMTSLPLLDIVELECVLRNVRLPNGVYLTTASRRFADIDPITLRLASATPRTILHDVGVSSGVTSLELYDAFCRASLPVVFHVSDKYSDLRVRGTYVHRIHDVNGGFLEGYCFGIVAASHLRWTGFLSCILGYLLSRWPARGPSRVLSLLDPRLQNLIRSDKVRKIDYDVFNPDRKEEFTYVRCMNLLNASYFSAAQLDLAVGGLARSLRPGGVLQIGSTDSDSGINRVGFYRKQSSRLHLLQEVNDGSDIKQTIARCLAIS